MAVENDDSIALPTPPPPRPAARREAMEAALRKFDGIEDKPAKQPARSWRALHQRQLGALATAAVIVVVSIPVALTVLRDQPKPMAPEARAPAVVRAEPVPAAPSEDYRPQPAQDQVTADVPRSRLPLQPHEEAAPPSLVPEEQKAVSEAPAVAAAPPPPAPPPPPPPAPPASAQAKSEQYSQEAGSEEIVLTGTRMARSNLGKPSSADVMAGRSREPAKAAAANESDRFLSRLQAAVRANDKSTIVGLVALPLRVNFDGGAKTYKDRGSIQRDFDRIFTPRVKQAILNQKADELFTNDQGSMIGDGQVWFDQSCSNSSCSKKHPARIKAINP